ncbi:LPXTG cell wall anchor domain-containing protein [Weissella muntiaci]|uniref:LPXTG cell wall anchor domain-containing protein n=1 Tax=Weissella muntiaci TaxID=2508881 RepID=A0A6C2C9E6_9LACO|nr:LPXTG cell wall anchor domain-containing protein [Weissella muntiaci]TYC50534.1 LPXTG cell wall anchor domain-containing protein [Weissella muntiaci]
MKYKIFGLGMALGLALVLQTGYPGVKADNVDYSTSGDVGFVGKYPEKNKDTEINNRLSPYYGRQNYQNGHPVLPNTGDVPITQNILIPAGVLSMGIGLLIFKKRWLSRSS